MELDEQAMVTAEAESKATAQVAECKGRAELMQTWLNAVDTHQLEIVDEKQAIKDNKRILQVTQANVHDCNSVECLVMPTSSG